jgi:hypothetical protein
MAQFASVALALGVYFAAGLGLLGAWAWWQGRQKIVGRVMVNLIDGTALEGVLLRTTRTQLTLGSAKLVGESTEPIPLDGTVYVERSTVHFVQGY